ncbi:MAG: HEAT repeat domain-containing protein [Syntrophorhabdales bacterium]|jgi:HEAT repeat protein
MLPKWFIERYGYDLKKAVSHDDMRSLIMSFEHKDHFHEHWEVVEALTQRKDQAIDYLTGFLGSQPEPFAKVASICDGAVVVLSEIGLPAIRPLLVSFGRSGLIIETARPGQAEATGRIIGRIGIDAIHCLAQLLKEDEDPYVRAYAAFFLALRVHQEAVQPLIEALNDPHPFVTEYVRKSLSYFKIPEALDVTAQSLTHPDQFVRWKAALVLGRAGDARALNCLLELVNYAEAAPIVQRAEAVRLLGKLGDESAISAVIRAMGYCWGISAGDVRLNAAAALKEMSERGFNVKELLFHAMNDENRLIKDWAACVLGILGDQRALKPCIALLEELLEGRHDVCDHGEQSWHYARFNVQPAETAELERRSAEEAQNIARLKAQGDLKGAKAAQETWSATYELLNEGNYVTLMYKDVWELNVNAAKALGRLKDPTAVEVLSKALFEGHGGGHSRWAAAEALGLIGDPRAVEPLTKALKDKNFKRYYGTGAVLMALEQIKEINER